MIHPSQDKNIIMILIYFRNSNPTPTPQLKDAAVIYLKTVLCGYFIDLFKKKIIKK